MMTYVLPNVDTDYRDVGFESSVGDGKKDRKRRRERKGEEGGGGGWHALSNGSWFGVVTISSFSVLVL